MGQFALCGARAADISHRNEEDPARRGPGRIPEPDETRPTVCRKRGSEGFGVAPNSISRRRRVRNDQEPRDTATPPAPLAGDPRGEPTLAIEGHHRAIRVADRRLDLDDDQPTSTWMATHDIDRSALPVDREGHFNLGLPARRLEQPDGSGDRQAMLLVDQSVKALTSPAKVQLESSAQRFADRHEIRPGDSLDLAALDTLDDAAREPGSDREIDLSQAHADTEGPNGTAEPPAIHPRILTVATSPPINGAQ